MHGRFGGGSDVYVEHRHTPLLQVLFTQPITGNIFLDIHYTTHNIYTIPFEPERRRPPEDRTKYRYQVPNLFGLPPHEIFRIVLGLDDRLDFYVSAPIPTVLKISSRPAPG